MKAEPPQHGAAAEPSPRGAAQRGPASAQRGTAQGGAAAAAGERECIDLTGDDAPLPRKKRERLSCDLTVAEGTPKWEVRKKPERAETDIEIS